MLYVMSLYVFMLCLYMYLCYVPVCLHVMALYVFMLCLSLYMYVCVMYLELLAEAINKHVPSMNLPTNCHDHLSTEIYLESVNHTEAIAVYKL